MNAEARPQAATRGATRTAARIALWIVTLMTAAGLAGAGAAKFLAADVWNELFLSWGYPGWFKSFVGATEILGAAALVVPALASWAALYLAAVMVGASWTVVAHDSELGVAASLTYLVLLGIIGWSRRGDRMVRGRGRTGGP